MWYDSLKGMAKIYAKMISNGERTLEEVPKRWRDKIAEVMPADPEITGEGYAE